MRPPHPAPSCLRDSQIPKDSPFLRLHDVNYLQVILKSLRLSRRSTCYHLLFARMRATPADPAGYLPPAARSLLPL